MFRQIIKKLNDFRFTSILATIISGVAGLYALGSFFLYHFAGPLDPEYKNLIRMVGFQDHPYLGMVLFFTSLATLVCAIIVVYVSVPYIKNKEKLTPKKSTLLTGFIGAPFELATIILMVVLAVSEHPQTVVGIWLTFPLGILSMCGTALYLIPYLKCDFYMPEIKRD